MDSWKGKQPPKDYVPGLGRGAAGFSTRGDVGPAAGETAGVHILEGSGSRAAEMRIARIKMKEQQQARAAAAAAPPPGQFADAFEIAIGQPSEPNFDQEDDDADRIYNAIDERMKVKRKKKRKVMFEDAVESSTTNNSTSQQRPMEGKIGDQFIELKDKLSEVTEEQWDAIPDVGDSKLKRAKRREDVFTPLPDSVIQSQNAINTDSTASTNVDGVSKSLIDQSQNDGFATVLPSSGFKSVISNISGLAEARSTVLGMSLDKSDSTTNTSGGKTVIDPKGYLTSLSTVKIASAAEVGDINKARLLLKSVRETNPLHGPGWIAAARVEEAAGKIAQARKVIQNGCEACPENEDVWLEAARLHPKDTAKSVLATAVRHIPASVKIYLYAADLEDTENAKRAVLRKGLEAIPNSVTLWKAAIELENVDDARLLLGVAVEKVPQSIDMWLALAKLETYENARKVLNQARRKLPAERAIWIAAAKLEESQNHDEMVDKIIEKAIQILEKHDAVVSREQWLKEAEAAEAADAPITSSSIVKYTIGVGVDAEDRQRTWSDDAKSVLSRGSVATARAILAQCLTTFPSKKAFWLQAMELEKHHGTVSSLDEVLDAACKRLPHQEIFWLFRAKQKWLEGAVGSARDILTEAFAANPDSESIWLAAVKLEWESNEYERARVLLSRARERAPTARVYMKSALLERECKDFARALEITEKGVQIYAKYEKFYMMGGQINNEDLNDETKSRDFFQRGLNTCPNCIVLWKLASRLEESCGNVIKARSLLDVSRLKNPKNDELWYEAVLLEKRASNEKLASSLLAKGLQECPNSGVLRAEAIEIAARSDKKARAADAIKHCPDDPRVITAVATLFSSERKYEKARKWFERAVILNPSVGDSWARYYDFEKVHGTVEQQQAIRNRCVKAEPKYGEYWCCISKHMEHRRKDVAAHLDLVAKLIHDNKK